MKRLTLDVAVRNESGRCAMRRLREIGKVPAVIYGKSGTTSLEIGEKELKTLLKEKGNSASLIDVRISGKKTFLSDIAEIQKDPVTDKFLHIDFHEVSKSDKMTTTVPLEFSGESVGVKNNGGVLDIARHEVNVRCLPSDLPSSICVDVSSLDVGDIIHLGDLSVPDGVELLGDRDIPVASCMSVVEEVSESASTEQASAEEPTASASPENKGKDKAE